MPLPSVMAVNERALAIAALAACTLLLMGTGLIGVDLGGASAQPGLRSARGVTSTLQ